MGRYIDISEHLLAFILHYLGIRTYMNAVYNTSRVRRLNLIPFILYMGWVGALLSSSFSVFFCIKAMLSWMYPLIPLMSIP